MPDGERDVHPAPGTALADYPRVATCPACTTYLTAPERRELIDSVDPTVLVAAVLGHHDSGHRRDLRRVASQHFG